MGEILTIYDAEGFTYPTSDIYKHLLINKTPMIRNLNYTFLITRLNKNIAMNSRKKGYVIFMQLATEENEVSSISNVK